MGKLVVKGAKMACSFGAAPATLLVARPSPSVTKLAVASTNDHAPNTNIPPFGTCSSLQNPQVASATAAAFGVLTPVSCSPVTPGAWVPGAAKVKVARAAALVDTCTLNCSWGGLISITDPGQQKVKGK